MYGETMAYLDLDYSWSFLLELRDAILESLAMGRDGLKYPI